MPEQSHTALAPTTAPGAGPSTGRTPAPLGWPYVAVSPTDDHPLARRLIGMFGLVLGASAGLFVGGMAATLLAALLHPFVPHLARILLMCGTLFSLAMGAVVGRRVLQRETFE